MAIKMVYAPLESKELSRAPGLSDLSQTGGEELASIMGRGSELEQWGQLGISLLRSFSMESLPSPGNRQQR
jgi:hypothetical protein